MIKTIILINLPKQPGHHLSRIYCPQSNIFIQQTITPARNSFNHNKKATQYLKLSMN